MSRVGGITLDDIAENVEALHSKAFDPLGRAVDLTLDTIRISIKMRSGGEEHRYNPATIHMLQKSTRMGDYRLFQEYTRMVDEERSGNLRSLMDFRFPQEGVPLEEVESVEEIVKRFKTGAMSYGSISQEAHETLAIAMNLLHGKSNTGEGGESEGTSGFRRDQGRPVLGHQAGGKRKVRGYQPVSGQRQRDPDQDGAGGQSPARAATFRPGRSTPGSRRPGTPRPESA